MNSERQARLEKACNGCGERHVAPHSELSRARLAGRALAHAWLLGVDGLTLGQLSMNCAPWTRANVVGPREVAREA